MWRMKLLFPLTFTRKVYVYVLEVTENNLDVQDTKLDVLEDLHKAYEGKIKVQM